MKTFKKIIYALLGLLLTGVVALVGIILFAEYSGERFFPGTAENVSDTSATGEESRLVYDENGNLAELPAGVLPAESEEEPVPAPTAEAAEETAAEAEVPDAPASDGTVQTYIMNKESAIFHKESCPDAANISEENRLSMTASRDDVSGRGYSPCQSCNP